MESVDKDATTMIIVANCSRKTANGAENPTSHDVQSTAAICDKNPSRNRAAPC